MLSIYNRGFQNKEERMSYKPVICNNVLTSIKTLCEQSDAQATRGEATQVHPDLEPSKRYILDMKMQDGIDPNLGAHIKALWLDQGIQRTDELRARYQLTDSAAYFFARIDEIVDPDFCPTLQDVLRSRVRTTGIVEHELEIEHNRFKIFDVGGQRNERKKWIHCFSEVTAVIFVAAISEYDMVLFEDENTNRMTEALDLFSEICNSPWFTKTSIILFLNKADLFAEKLQKVPLTDYFPAFPGPNTFEAAWRFLADQFLSRRKNARKQVYTHVTCATDSSQMQVVFKAVKDTVIRQSLQEGGLLTE
jgi:GTPase SAR1 family protein